MFETKWCNVFRYRGK